MIETKTEIDIFKLFTKAGVDNYKLFNEICDLVKKEQYIARGHCDSEHYDTLVKLINSENNAGWDKEERHSARIKVINSAIDSIVDRSETFLP